MMSSMLFSKSLIPTLRESPSEAQIVSHSLMLRAGMIRQSSAGIYSWLPLGLRVLRKIEQIVREEQNRIGANELLMPTIQPADLWKRSGRYDGYGKEMLRITDRHGRNMLYGPTNEEQISEIFSASVDSYRDLPKILYHIQWKFRDEIRPRFGVMRGREFLMKDAYSFDISVAAAMQSYYKSFIAYLRSFERMMLKAIPMRADTGPIGGDHSHEFIILAETGESKVFCDKAIFDLSAPQEDVNQSQDLKPVFDRWTQLYAATDDIHDQADYEARIPQERRCEARGIEVGHIFFFGDKYSKPMNVFISTDDGQRVPVQMGSYGIGISRLVGAIIEAWHDDKGILWPESVAPFKAGLVNASPRDEKATSLCDALYATLCKKNIDILYDDREERSGVKLKDLELIGLPFQIIIGARNAEQGKVELASRRAEDENYVMTPDQIVDFFLKN